MLWERLFQRCLVSQVENDLRRLTVVQLNKIRDDLEGEEPLTLLLQALPRKQNRLIEVNLPNLIHDIIDAFYNDHSSQNAVRNFRWSLGSGDLPSFVCNYIATHDCFLRSSEGVFMSAEVTLDHYTMPVVHAITRVHWQPPDVKFEHVPSQLGPRGQYHIAPYREPDSSSYNRFPDDVVYTVTRSTSMIQWDKFSELFRAQAPDTPTTSETLIQASIVTKFPGDVRFERVSRYVVKVEIVDTLQVHAIPDEYRPQTEDASTPPIPSYISEPWSNNLASPRLQQHRDSKPAFFGALRKCFPDSPKKRKAVLRSTSYDGMSPVELVYDESDTDVKRQKLALRDDIDMHAATIESQRYQSAVEECEVVLEALETFRQNVENRTTSVEREPSEVALRLYAAVAPAFHVVYAAIKKELLELKDPKDDCCRTPVKEKKEIPIIPTGQVPTPPDSPMESRSSFASTSESASNRSIPKIANSAMELSSPHHLRLSELSQDEIQKNYREFEEVAKRRKTDPTTTFSCDVGDIEFERIFMEDSEVEGVSGLGGLSDGMGGLMVDED